MVLRAVATEIPVDHLLLAGYGGAIVLLALYFSCESGPCHWSRRREGVYLAVVLGLLYAVSLLWTEGKFGSSEFGGVICVQHLVRLALIYRLVKRFVIPSAHPRFFDHAPARMAARLHMPSPDQKARDKASQITSLVEDIAGLASQKEDEGEPSLAEKAFEPALFSMLMLEDLMWAFKDLSTFLNYPLLALLILLPLLGLRSALQGCLQIRRLSTHVHQLIEDVIDQRSEGVLQLVLASVNMGMLVEVLHWESVRLLAERALEEELLCTVSKAILVDALQMKGIRYNRAAQQAVRGLILSCQGQELTTLKNLIDGSGSYHNLYKLVYIDITNFACRQDVLGHFVAEASVVRRKLGGPAGVKVLSDIDDTLYSSGGLYPAGRDRRFPRHMVYPGCLSLFRILDRDWKADTPSCNLVFLSARPHLYKDISEDHSYERFRTLVDEGCMHSFPTLLPGRLRESLWSAIMAACTGGSGWQLVGKRKFTTYLNYRELHREYDFCFCGDNGQGDLLAGQLMLQEQSETLGQPSEAADLDGPRLLCVLIHRVLPDQQALALEPSSEQGDTWREDLEKQGLVIHDTYVGAAAALHAHDPCLVSAEQLAEVARAAMDEFDAARWADDESSRWCLQAEKALQKDLAVVDSVLNAAGQEPLPLLRRTSAMQRLRHSAGTGPLPAADSEPPVDSKPSLRLGSKHSLRSGMAGRHSSTYISQAAACSECGDFCSTALGRGCLPGSIRSPVGAGSPGGRPGEVLPSPVIGRLCETGAAHSSISCLPWCS